MSASDLVTLARELEKPVTYFYPPAVTGPTANALSAEEKELISYFRRVPRGDLQAIAVNLVKALAEARADSEGGEESAEAG